jgi:hypothetical protein
MSRQVTLESFSCGSKTALGRSEGNGEHVGDFAEAQLLELVKYEDLTTAIRHPLHRVVEHDAGATEAKKMLGVDSDGRICVLRFLGETPLVTNPHAAHVARLVRRSAEQEGALLTSGHVVELAVQREEHLLRSVVDIGVGNTETAQHSSDEAHLLADNCAKSPLARTLIGVVFFHTIARRKNQS